MYSGTHALMAKHTNTMKDMVGLKTPPSGPRACAPTGSGVQRRADQGAAHSSRPRRRQQAARRRQKLAARSQKTIRSLRKAGDQGAGSKSRTAEATSSSCCLRYGPRPMPSQDSTAAAHCSRPRRQQQATHRQSDQQLVLLSLRTSACAEPKNNKTAANSSRPRHRQQDAQHRSDEQLVLH